MVLHVIHLLFFLFQNLKNNIPFPHIFRDCDEGTCKDKSNILYAWARNAPPTRLPKGIGSLIWSSCVQGQEKKENMEVRTWHIWEHRIIFLLWVIDRNCLNINLMNYEMYYATYCGVLSFCFLYHYGFL